MIEEIKLYLSRLNADVPQYVLEGLLSIFCIGVIVMFALKGLKANRGIALLFLVEYVFLFFCTTVLFRAVSNTRRYDFTPLWSYKRPDLLIQIFMNIMAFVPIGMLLGMSLKKDEWWKVIGLGCLFSLLIETMQLICNKGFCEIDDVLHNTLGCAIGFSIYKVTQLLFVHFHG